MEELKNIINKHSHNFTDFEYYYLLIDKIEGNLHKNPDIAIECCKALIEGICSTILVYLDKSLTQENILKNYNLQKIFKEYKEKLADYDSSFEIEFINGFNHSVKLIGEIRTKRGDIAHGKKTPKEFNSSIDFAKLIVNLTSSLLVYSLEHFFNITFLKELKYEDYQEFNYDLDEQNQLPGKVKYSLALFEQYPEDYIIQLKQYLSDKESSKLNDDIEEENIEDIKSLESISENIIDEYENILVNIEENNIDNIYEKYQDLLKKENSEDTLKKLCNEESLYINEVLKLIDKYLFDEREPLSSDFVKLLKNKPKLLDREKIVEDIKHKIFDFINENIKD